MASIVHVNMGHCLYYHITFRKAPRPHTRRVLLINTSNYKTGGGSPVLCPCLSLAARWKLDYIWEAVRLPSRNRINAPVYLGIFFIFRRIHTQRRQNVEAEKQEGEGHDIVVRGMSSFPASTMGFAKFNSTVREAAGWSNFAAPPPPNCRLTNIPKRKLRKLREDRDETAIATIFTRPRWLER